MSKQTEFIAHIKKNKQNEWQMPHDLAEHCKEVGKLASIFAKDFGSEWAKVAGYWHDLGKYNNRFQDYIRNASGFEREEAHIENNQRSAGVNHSIVGAVYAYENIEHKMGMILAYMIAGHHAGLADWQTPEAGKSALKNRLGAMDTKVEYDEAFSEEIPTFLLNIPNLISSMSLELTSETIHIWIRMLFSCLVDADFLDTERYMSPERFSQRSQYQTLDNLYSKYQKHMKQLSDTVSNQSDDAPLMINVIRQSILKECLDAADLSEKIFSLTVPTGGGKTLASLGFALKHALKNNQKRIIYAIPFTSIIEQNAGVFRQCLGDDCIVEHHSNLDGDEDKETSRRRLASENWDAPLIVTTNVQLFESLFASRTSRCRKLHNITNSVIILDEAQQIPREFQEPITHMMAELSKNYGVTWVLCTATQPKLDQSKDAFGRILLRGLPEVTEIIQDPLNLAVLLKRVKIQMPSIIDGKIVRTSFEELAAQLLQERCVLVIVNTRKEAQSLFNLLDNQSDEKSVLHYHLSANMCAEHRTEILDEIKAHLKDKSRKKSLRVVSTQLIEAGVDVDFPVVYRALAGLDSIAQSAGRCNREGKLPNNTLGKVVVFLPEKDAPSGSLLQGQKTTEELLISGLLDDPLSPLAFKKYFERFNGKAQSFDKHKIMGECLTAPCAGDAPYALQFKTASGRFQLIPEAGQTVIVPFVPYQKVQEGQTLLERVRCDKTPIEQWINILEKDASEKWVYRKLQRYSVTLHDGIVKQMIKEGALMPKAGLLVLVDTRYNHLGVLPPDTLLAPSDSIFD